MSSFKIAAGYIMPFGQHRGKTIDAIATTDEGLAYLDWLRGELEKKQQHRSVILDRATAYGHICTYLDDSTIAAEVARLAKGK